MTKIKISAEKKATIVSSSVAAVLTILKLSVGIVSGSVAVLASAIDSVLDLFVSLGVPKKHITVCDSKGVIYIGREGADQGRKKDYAVETSYRTLADALVGADVFLGVSQPRLVSQEMVKHFVIV